MINQNFVEVESFSSRVQFGKLVRLERSSANKELSEQFHLLLLDEADKVVFYYL